MEMAYNKIYLSIYDTVSYTLKIKLQAFYQLYYKIRQVKIKTVQSLYGKKNQKQPLKEVTQI